MVGACPCAAGCSSTDGDVPAEVQGPARPVPPYQTEANPSAFPFSAEPPGWLRALYEEIRGLRQSVHGLESRLSSALPAAAVPSVSVEAAQALLGCGRSRLFELLKSGALHRAPKVGRSVRVTTASLAAFQDSGRREPVPNLKRRPPRRNTGRAEKEAILKLIRPV